MPLPTSSMMHQNRPLETMTMATMQEDSAFILMQATEGAVEEVDQKSNTYYVFDEGDWNRMEMKPRGSSQESEGSGWRLSTDSFSCDRYACHKDFDWSDTANADVAVADTDAQAKLYLANQGRLYGDYLVSQEIFTTSIWTSDDLTGTAGSPTVGTSFKQWDDSAGDPQNNIFQYSQRIQGRIGFEANTMIVGAVTHAKILSNAQVKADVKPTMVPTKKALRQLLAAYFGVDYYFVATAFHNTAVEGATKSFSYICDSKSAWLGYVGHTSGKYQMSAFKLFAFKDGGRAQKGVVIRSIPVPLKTSIRHEIETHWDVKKVATDAGVMFSAAVA